MIIQRRSFPHPVLSPLSDDVVPNHFSLNVSVTSDATTFYIDTHFAHSNDTLVDVLHHGLATFAIHVECKRNFYRELFLLASETQRVSIPASALVGRIEVCGLVIANAPLEHYQISGSHPDYAGATFQIQSGDVLAAAPTVVFEAFVDYDPLDKLSSILTIRRSDEVREGPMIIDTTEDLIVATLAQSDYEHYTTLRGDPAVVQLLANQVVIPALFQAIAEIKEIGPDDRALDMEKRWFRSIVKKLDDNAVQVYDPATSVNDIVQMLLKWPLRRSLEGLIQLTSVDDTP